MAGLAIQQKSDLPSEAPLTLDPAIVDVDDKAVRRLQDLHGEIAS